MARVNDSSARTGAIATAIAAEFARQEVDLGRIDLDALARAVEMAVEPPPPIAEGKRPDDLNSTNDD